MDADREREIRELAARLTDSKRHHRIGLVLGELLGEIDVLRGDDVPAMSYDEMRAKLEEWVDLAFLGRSEHKSGAEVWREAVRRRTT